jgi:hypothetical protein
MVGLYGIQKDIGQDFNGEPIVNGVAGRVDVMLETRAPVDICEQLDRSRSNTGWNGKDIGGEPGVAGVVGVIVCRAQDSFPVQ